MKKIIGLFILCIVAICGYSQSDSYTIYLIGDSGAPVVDRVDPVFAALKERIDQEDENSAVIFLGDNIYHHGMPPKGLDPAHRKEAEKKMMVQLDALEDYVGEVYFIPGNHDWNDASPDGIDYITAQEEFIEFYLNRGDVLIPDHGCPGPEKKKLNDHIVLLAMDSQWWLHPHPEGHTHESDCKNKNPYQIIQELKEQLDKHDDDIVIIALHHPLYSDGSHNGHFTIKDHLFPLTLLSSKAYIPLPGIGSLYPFFRSTFGDRQDMPHPLYQNLKDMVLEAVADYDNIIFASGHEHNLQYFYKDGNHFIKSGSGSKTSPLPKNNEAAYSSEDKGFAKLTVTDGGNVSLDYITIDKKDEAHKTYHQPIIEGPLRIPDFSEPYELRVDTVKRAANKTYYKGRFHRLMFGQIYRRDWAALHEFRPFNLSTEQGGLRPIKTGGGYSSNSLRLEDKNEDEYVLRSVQKGVSKVVPIPFRNSFVQEIFQDQIAGSQPYAALAVPPLADAAGVYHTNPEIVYLPHQEGLGDFDSYYAGALYLYEERPAGDREDEESFGNSKKIISYSKLLEKLKEKSEHHIHQDQVLRSRLFDIYLGDWDRHDDQWRWASFKEKHNGEKLTFYEPIPRDRDQVFFRYEGFIPWLTKVVSPELRKFQSFGPKIKNVKYLGYNARHFDRSFLNQMERQDWINIAEEIATSQTDSVIQHAIDQLPPPVQELQQDFYTKSLQKRRADLTKYAEDYYQYIAKYVDVVGSHDEETFDVERYPDGSVRVLVYAEGDKDRLSYERLFHGDETKEIRLFGLKDKDKFIISGEQKKGPLIRIIGGTGKDYIRDESTVKKGKSSVIYDSLEDNDIVFTKEMLDKRSDHYPDNQYDRKEFYYNQPVGFIYLGFNPDDGVKVAYTQTIKTYGFRKTPFKNSHSYTIEYALGSQEVNLGYEWQSKSVFGNADFNLSVSGQLPSDVNNFFGLSNQTFFNVNEIDDRNYFRYNQHRMYLRPGIQWTDKYELHKFVIGPYFQLTDLEDQQGRFITESAFSGLGPADFESTKYIGIEGEYSLHRVDSDLDPTIGMKFNFSPSYNFNIGNPDLNFLRFSGDLTLYNYLWIPRPLVLATKITGGINFGDFSFFQAQYLGRDKGLRSFRQNRFGGRSAFSINNDLRVKLFTIDNIALPLTVGIIGSYDIGRVWNDNEINGDIWHHSYGGGIYINPFDVLPISFYYLGSRENESLFMTKFGFAF